LIQPLFWGIRYLKTREKKEFSSEKILEIKRKKKEVKRG